MSWCGALIHFLTFNLNLVTFFSYTAPRKKKKHIEYKGQCVSLRPLRFRMGVTAAYTLMIEIQFYLGVTFSVWHGPLGHIFRMCL